MRGRLNDIFRRLISISTQTLGAVLQVSFFIRLFFFKQRQQKLRQRFGIDNQTRILPFGPDTEKLIASAAQNSGADSLWATTSGTTGHPKRLFYTRRRLNCLKWIFTNSFARMCWVFMIKRSSLYVFKSFDEDDSLTNLLLNDRKLPGYFTTLQAPYRVQCESSIKELVNNYGSAAVRLWLILLSNPGVLYATNPSTIVAFFDDVQNNWPHVRQLTKDWHEQLERFPNRLRRIARRIDSTGSQERVARVASSDSPLTLADWAPAVAAYMCWTGGYVQPFLDRLTDFLPSKRYQLIPMYSMSTETVETVPYFGSSQTSFVPLAPGVLYEFLSEGTSDEPAHLLRPDQLVPGRVYSMVVSDGFGLKRYQTEDLFRCERMLHGLPNLSFLRRRSLEYSFTGEKLTAEQLSAVYEQLQVDSFLTCVPCSSSTSPHYRVFAVGGETDRDLSSDIDEHLCKLNCEYKSKRHSQRLGAITFESITLEEFRRRIPSGQASWETQFKFLPLYQTPISCQTEH